METTIIFFRIGKNKNAFSKEEEKMINQVLPMSLNHIITHEDKQYMIKEVDWDFDYNRLYVTAYSIF